MKFLFLAIMLASFFIPSANASRFENTCSRSTCRGYISVTCPNSNDRNSAFITCRKRGSTFNCIGEFKDETVFRKSIEAPSRDEIRALQDQHDADYERRRELFKNAGCNSRAAKHGMPTPAECVTWGQRRRNARRELTRTQILSRAKIDFEKYVYENVLKCQSDTSGCRDRLRNANWKNDEELFDDGTTNGGRWPGLNALADAIAGDGVLTSAEVNAANSSNFQVQGIVSPNNSKIEITSIEPMRYYERTPNGIVERNSSEERTLTVERKSVEGLDGVTSVSISGKDSRGSENRRVLFYDKNGACLSNQAIGACQSLASQRYSVASQAYLRTYRDCPEHLRPSGASTPTFNTGPWSVDR